MVPLLAQNETFLGAFFTSPREVPPIKRGKQSVFRMPRLSSRYATHLHAHASRPSNKSLPALFRTVISTQIVTRDLCEATFASEIGP